MPSCLEEDIALDKISDLYDLRIQQLIPLLGIEICHRVQELSLGHVERLECLVIATLFLLDHPSGLKLEVAHEGV